MANSKPPEIKIGVERGTDVEIGSDPEPSEFDLLMKNGKTDDETYISFERSTGEVDRHGTPILKKYRVTTAEYAQLEAAGVI